MFIQSYNHFTLTGGSTLHLAINTEVWVRRLPDSCQSEVRTDRFNPAAGSLHPIILQAYF